MAFIRSMPGCPLCSCLRISPRYWAGITSRSLNIKQFCIIELLYLYYCITESAFLRLKKGLSSGSATVAGQLERV